MARSNASCNSARRAGSRPDFSSANTSCSISSTSGGLGRRRPMRRAIDWRMVRPMSICEGDPSTAMPARTGAAVSVATIWFFTRSGSSKSSKNRSRNSSRVSTKRNPSSPSLPPWPSPWPPWPAAAARALQPVAGGKLLVAGQHELALPAGEHGVETRLVQRVGRDGDSLVLAGLADGALAHRVARRPGHRRPGAGDHALPVLEVLAMRVRPAVDDVQWRGLRPTASHACTIPPGGAPAVRCSRARPCG